LLKPYESIYICKEIGFRNLSGIKREDRCKSGAIPVAVRSPSNFSERKERERKIVEHIPLSRLKLDGKVSTMLQARRPASFTFNHSRLSGERQGV